MLTKAERITVKEFRNHANKNSFSEKDFVNLLKQYQKTPTNEVRDYLATVHYPLILSLATRFKNTKIGIADLISEGLFGLHAAMLKFNPKLGTKFITYATSSVERSMKLAVTYHTNMVRLPHHLTVKLVKIQTKLASLKKDKDDSVDIDDIKNTSFRNILEKAPFMYATVPSSDVMKEVTNKQEVSWFDSEFPGDSLELADLKLELIDLIDHTLEGKEKKIIQLYYGIDTDYSITSYEVISSLVSIQIKRLITVKNEALLKLRAVADEDLLHYLV